MREESINKLMKMGISIYERDISRMVIRELREDLTWRVIKRNMKNRKTLNKHFDKIMRDPMAIEI